MNLLRFFKISSILLDFLGILLPLIWIIYYVRYTPVNELIFNLSIVLVLLMASVSHLFQLFIKK